MSTAQEMRSLPIRGSSNDQWKKSRMAEVDAMEREGMRKRRVDVCKAATKDIAKKAVLYGVMAIYTVLGGYAFVALEQTNEKEMCLANEALYDRMQSTAAQSLWKMSRSFRSPDEQDSQRDLIQGQMDEFRSNVMTIGYDGRNCSMLGTPNEADYKWNFAASLLFSVTIFTTVGYGNITPVTTWGRLVCITYAMFGIPLMFVCLASIGEILGDVFRFVYFKICCLGACQRRRRHPRLKGASTTGPLTPDDPQQHPQYPPSDDRKKELVEDDDDDDDDDDDEMSIPITVTLLVIAGYIGLGTIMFANWEGWDAMQAGYYCFITVSTIGFGDVVPGFSTNDPGSGLKMIVAALYLLFGMSLMSMGFDLIQYEMKNRVPSHAAPSSANKDEPSIESGNNQGVPPPTAGPPSGQPVWSDGNRAREAMPSGVPFEMTTVAAAVTGGGGGVKKRGYQPGNNDLGQKAIGAMSQYPAAAAATAGRLGLKGVDKIA